MLNLLFFLILLNFQFIQCKRPQFQQFTNFTQQSYIKKKSNTNFMKKGFEILRNKADFSIELVPENPFFSLIWLHGLGDSSQGFYDYFQLPQSPVHKGARIKLLQAPLRPVSINGGMKCNSWYDIKTFEWTAPDHQLYSLDEIKQSLKILDSHVEAQFKFWQQKFKDQPKQQTYKRIFVGGFSQGCATSLLYALTADVLLGGIIGYSGHVFRSFDLKNKDKLDMLIYHGKNDSVIQCKKAMTGYQTMIGQRPNLKLTLIPYLQHSVQIDQLQQTTIWMLDKLKSNKIQN